MSTKALIMPSKRPRKTNITSPSPPSKRRKLSIKKQPTPTKQHDHFIEYPPHSPSPSPPPPLLCDNDDNISIPSQSPSPSLSPSMFYQLSPSPPWGRSPSPPPSAYFHKGTKKKSRWDEVNEPATLKNVLNPSLNLMEVGVKSLIHSINLQQQKQQKVEPLLLDKHGNALNLNEDSIDINDEFNDFSHDLLVDGDDGNETDYFFDDEISVKPAERSRRSKAFQFIKQGTYTQKRKEENAQWNGHQNNENNIYGGEDDEGLEWLDIVPIVEWWDMPLLSVSNDYLQGFKSEMITDLVTNPKILRPELLRDNGGNLEKDYTQSAIPMFLTKQERKKMNRIRKKEEHQNKTDEIRLGLREPPEPRLKISNVLRVLGAAAIRDPTAAESIARAQMWKRKLKHELHNATNQLTAAERREKKRKKLQEDTSKEVHVSLFVIFKLFGKLNKGKICLNAQQRNLTGALIMLNCKEEESENSEDDHEDVTKNEQKEKKVDVKGIYDENELSLNMIIVEGGPKGIRKYQRLLLHRIKWPMNTNGDEQRKNCHKIWEGTVAKRSFQTFHQKKVKNEIALRNFLKIHHVQSYWDMLKNSPAVSRI